MIHENELPEPERPAIPPGVILGGRHRVPVIPAHERLALFFLGAGLGVVAVLVTLLVTEVLAR